MYNGQIQDLIQILYIVGQQKVNVQFYSTIK